MLHYSNVRNQIDLLLNIWLSINVERHLIIKLIQRRKNRRDILDYRQFVKHT